MKYNGLITAILTVVIFSGCGSSTKTIGERKTISVNAYVNGHPFEINVTEGKGHNHPTFAIWLEDMEGNYLKTIFLTKSYATGIYGHAALTDSTWSNQSGESYRPAALPYWSHKKGLIEGAYVVPDKDHPFTDGHTGATPTGSFLLKSQLPANGDLRILMEVNQTWDWNKYWTNNKFPDNLNYKSSAQPSVVYAVRVNVNKPMPFYIMNPIGHGHYAGEDGKLYTDLSTLTSALEIFNRIEVTIK